MKHTQGTLNVCKDFTPHCLPCPYREGHRATECPFLQDLYAHLNDVCRRAGRAAKARMLGFQTDLS
jgi:hypothetical protein